MARQYLRPGPWKIVNSSGSTQELRIDNDVFEIAGNSTSEFDCAISCTFDDTNLTAYRNPVAPVVSTTQTGGVTNSSAFGVKTKPKLEAL